jgi:hypothetical protein
MKVEWDADEPREYRANGRGWKLTVSSKGPSGWVWQIKVDSPDIVATGTELKSHEAKEKAEIILRQIIQVFPQEVGEGC